MVKVVRLPWSKACNEHQANNLLGGPRDHFQCMFAVLKGFDPIVFVLAL